MFSMGQKVNYVNSNGKFPAKITRWIQQGTQVSYEIEFDDKNLIPPKMEVPENTLEKLDGSFSYKGLYDTDKNCPICSTPWHKIEFGMKVWYDCKKCNKKREDIENELKEFNNLLDGEDDSEDDWFLTF